MAHMTGTQIVALARVLAQDTSASQPAVSDASALLLLNDVILRYCNDVSVRHALIPASSSGLTYAANATMASVGISDEYDNIVAAYESDSSSTGTTLPPQLEHWTVEQILNAYQNDYDGSVVGSGTSGWQAYAWQRPASATSTESDIEMQVYVYPPLAATRYLTIRVAKNSLIAALTESPELTQRDARLCARFLAWEMARLHTRDEAFLQQILAPIPATVLDAYFESAKTHGWMQSSIRQTGALDG